MNEKTKEASLLKEKSENTGLKIGLERYALFALIAGILTIVAVLFSFSFSSLDNKIRETKTDLKEDIKEVKMELKEGIKEVKSIFRKSNPIFRWLNSIFRKSNPIFKQSTQSWISF